MDIIYMILPYTYALQSKLLTNDIKNFYTTRITAQKLYHYQYVVILGEAEPSNKDWLINDLFGFSNLFICTMNGYVDSFLNLFLRNISLKTKEEVLGYIQKMKMKEVNTQINIFWGLFSIEERNAFLNRFYPENIIVE